MKFYVSEKTFPTFIFTYIKSVDDLISLQVIQFTLLFTLNSNFLQLPTSSGQKRLDTM